MTYNDASRIEAEYLSIDSLSITRGSSLVFLLSIFKYEIAGKFVFLLLCNLLQTMQKRANYFDVTSSENF